MLASWLAAPLLALVLQTGDAAAFEAAFQRGLLAFAQNDPATALASFEEALRLQPDHTQARFHLSRALRETGKPERALEELLAIEGKMVDRFSYLLALARTYEDLKRFPEAREALVEAGKLRPRAARVPYLLGELLASEGKLAAALESMKQAAELQPDWVQPYRRAGEMALVLGDPQTAVENLEKAVKLAPDAPLVLVSLGDAYARVGRRDEAVTTWRRALALKPDMPKIEAQVGNVLFATGHAEEAFQAFRSALEQDPTDTGTRSALALALFSSRREDEAEKEFQELLSREPGNGLALYYLGVAAANRGERDLARRRFEAALPELQGPEGDLALLAGRAGETYPLRLTAEVDLAEVLLDAGETARAVELLEAALAKAPDHATAHYQLGLAYRKLERKEEAAAELTKFKQINDAREHDQLALKALESGDEETARRELESALAIYPSDRVAHGQLASLDLKRGEPESAARHLEYVVDYADSPESAFTDLLTYYCEQGNLERARALRERADARGLVIPKLCLEERKR